MTEYYFVVSGSEPQRASQAVRSHGMKTALHQKATQANKKNQQNDDPQLANARLVENTKRGLNGRFRLVARPKRKRHKQQDRIELVMEDSFKDLADYSLAASSYVSLGSVADSYIDPFGSIGVPSSPQVNVLLKYFLTRFVLNMSTSDTQKHWFAFAMSEPLIMHTTLALAGNGWLANAPDPDPQIRQEVLHQKGSAIRTINSLLSLSDVSTTLIAGVASLANVAAFEGSFHEADMHIRGLKKLLNFCGGYEAFINTPLVTRSVTWADLQAAAALGRSPAFPLVYEERMADLPQSLQEEPELPSLDTIADIVPGGNQVRRSFIMLRRALLVGSTSTTSLEIVRLHMHISDASILHLLFDEEESKLLQGPLRPLLLAAHVFLYLTMRQVPRDGAVAKALLRRLEESIQPMQMDLDAWKDHLPALIWIFFVGAAAASKLPAKEISKHWMWVQLKALCRLVLPTAKESLLKVLKGFLWSDNGYASFLDEFWNLEFDG